MWLDELKKMKEERNLTTKEISLGSGIPEPTLEKIFSGTTKDPKLTTMQQLVHFLGHTLDDLAPDEIKKAPAAEQEPEISLEASNRFLVDMGFIREGDDLSDDDLAFLSNIIGLLDGWFSRKSR